MGSGRTIQGSQNRSGRAAPDGVFREINERIVELGERFGYRDEPLLELLCECADSGCRERITITPAAYDEVRGAGGRHLVADRHEHSARVVARGDGYVVVEA